MNRKYNRDTDDPNTSPIADAHCAVKLTFTAVVTVDNCVGYVTLTLTGNITPGATALTRGNTVTSSANWLENPPTTNVKPQVAWRPAKFAKNTGMDTPFTASGDTSVVTVDGTNIKSATWIVQGTVMDANLPSHPIVFVYSSTEVV
jgi:hypothetical protein